jgi:hypothetical protein
MFGLDPQQTTVIALLLAIGAAGVAKQWVFGWVYASKERDLSDMTKDRDFWRDTALKSMGHTDKALGIEKDA